MSLMWTCHICGRDRPDAAISVRKSTVLIGGVEVGQNVRYCNDREACIEGSRTFSFFKDAAKP